MFVQMCSVEKTESVLVRRKVRRNPVEDNPDPVPMEIVDEILEIVGLAIPARRSEIPNGLVTPGP